jgi:hypothetical protein
MAKNTVDKLTKIALALPETVSEPAGEHLAFKVRKKVFAYYLNNHHGDGIVSVCCKVLKGDNAALVAADPVKFHMPAYIASRGWVGVRLDRGTIDWEEVGEFVNGSYRLCAPTTLVRTLPPIRE